MELFCLLKDPNEDAVIVVVNQGESLKLTCDTSDPNLSITWVQTLSQAGLYLVANDSRIHIENNGYDLEFQYVVQGDEEYYMCGVLNEETGTVQKIKKYFVYVRSKSKF